MSAVAPALSAAPVGWRAHGLLLLLAVVFADNFVGRQILAVMIEPIKTEFGVGDTAMGLISGLAFAAVYALTGLPAGRLVDRGCRAPGCSASCLLWALATMACGLAGGFVGLAIARMLVAVSESPTTSASLSLIADLYPPQRRSFAISCFTAAPTFSSIIGHLTAMSALATYLLWPNTLLTHIGSLPVPLAMLWCALYSFFAVWWVAPSYNLVTQLVPGNRRGTARALQTIVSTLLGIGVGPLLAGVLSDLLGPFARQDSLRYALVLVSLPVLGSVLLLLRTSRQVIKSR